MFIWLCAGAILFFFPMTGVAQTSATIAGMVKDTSGAVLPGATVEASSPALIEKVRTVVTDSEGQYKIVNLRPGVYKVTFTLTGFRTVERDNVELVAEATANVTVELSVGAVEETVTVTGATPLVDVQTITNHRVITQDVRDALPAGNAVMTFATLTPGVKMISTMGTPGNRDVGGNQGDNILNVVAYGSRNTDSPLLWDGMWYNNARDSAGGASQTWSPNASMAQEIVVDVAGHAAESPMAGPRVNAVPRDGSNVLHGTMLGSFTNSNFQSSNVTPALAAQGAGSLTSLKKIVDAAVVVGGPIVGDRLWFIAGTRYNLVDNYMPLSYYQADPLSPIYVPDKTQAQPSNPASLKWVDARLTAQLSPRNKIALYFDDQHAYQPFNSAARSGANIAPTGSTTWDTTPAYLWQGTYNSTVTNRLLIEAGATGVVSGWKIFNSDAAPNVIPIIDLGTGLQYRAVASQQRTITPEYNYRAKVSYVTGSHAFQVGSQGMFGYYLINVPGNLPSNDCDCSLQLLNGVPVQITVFTTPYSFRNNLDGMYAFFAQDQWTMKQLTVQGGARLDMIRSSVPAWSLPAVRWVGPRNFDAIDNVPNWKDFSPRIGMSWDLFGDGRTAVKASLGRYIEGVATGIAGLMNPVQTTVNSTTRSWKDTNGDFFPQESELGPLANVNFGKTVVAQTFDPAYLNGWGNRAANWELQTSVQHQLFQGLSVNAAYIRRSYDNILVNKNTLVSPSDYSSFCVTAPVDSRLLGGGGNQICGFTDINPDKFGQSFIVTQKASNFGNAYDIYNGFDFGVTARLPRGFLVQAGTNTGSEVMDNCDVVGKVDNPPGAPFAYAANIYGGNVGRASNPSNLASPSSLYCHVSPPFQTSFKGLGVIPLRWGIDASLTYQDDPGSMVWAAYTVTSAQVAPSLGRNLSAGPNSATTVQLVAPGTVYLDRVRQLDVRGTKTFRYGKARIQAKVDVYNLLNVSTPLTANTTYGPRWLYATSFMPGRFVKFGTQIDF
jgi:hypothetical protein